jgi:hypothetical protein
VHGEITASYSRIAPIPSPNFAQSRRDPSFLPFLSPASTNLRAPWPDHPGKALPISNVVFVALYTCEAHRGARLLNPALVKRERVPMVTVSAVHVDRPFSVRSCQIDACSEAILGQ